MKLTILNGVTTTVGAGGDVPKGSLAHDNRHRVAVISGSVDVSYVAEGDEENNLILLHSAKVPTDLDVYQMAGVKRFSFTANADSEVAVTSWSE